MWHTLLSLTDMLLGGESLKSNWYGLKCLKINYIFLLIKGNWYFQDSILIINCSSCDAALEYVHHVVRGWENWLAFAMRVFPFIPLAVFVLKVPLWLSTVILMILPGDRRTALCAFRNSRYSSSIGIDSSAVVAPVASSLLLVTTNFLLFSTPIIHEMVFY